MKKIIAFLTFFALTVFPAFSVSAASPMGETKASYTTSLTTSLSYTETHSVNDAGKQSGYQFTLDPKGTTRAIAAYGNYIYSRNTLSSMMKENASAIAGISGDCFALQSGVPCGTMVSDGVILCSNETSRPCIGIKKDGSLIYGTPSVNVSLSFGGYKFPARAYNKVPENGAGPFLLTSDFASSTKSTCACIEMIIKPSSSFKITNGTTIKGTVISLNKSTSDTVIPDGYIAYSAPKTDSYASYIANVAVGSACEITVSLSQGWQDAQFIISGEKEILKNDTSQVTDTKKLDARAAVGITGDGKAVFFACDGDGKIGVGLSENGLSQHMKSIGCTYAISLASGASVTASIRRNGEPEVINNPSSGNEKVVSNAVLFINSSPSNNTPAHLSVYTDTPFIKSGGTRIKLYAKPTDSSGRELESEINDLKFTVTGGGSISGNIYTSGGTGEVTVSAEALCGTETLRGSCTLTVVNRLDSIAAEKTWYNIPVGGHEKIDIKGYLTSIPVSISASALSWSYEKATAISGGQGVSACEYGYLDSSLVFHSNNKPATFKLIGRYGYQTVSVTLRISKNPITYTDFDSDAAFSSFLKLDSSNTYRYTDGKNNTNGMYFNGKEATYKSPLFIGNTVKYITLWAKGNVDSPYISLIREDGSRLDIPYTVEKDFSAYNGWNLLKATVPEDETDELYIVSFIRSSTQIDCTLDEVTVNYGTDEPIFCDTARSWAAAKIDYMFHLDVLSGTVLNGNRYYYPNNYLTRAEFAKIITSYYNTDIAKYESNTLTFIDTGKIPSWAVKYVKAAIGAHFMSGSSDKYGLIHFYPNEKITRAEVMSVIGRTLTNNGAGLSFSDANKIPSWATNDIKKVVYANIVSGYPDGTLRPDGYVTRAEIAAMIYALYDYQY